MAASKRKGQAQPQAAHAQPVDPGTVPAVAQASRKVGRYKRLAEIADTLDQAGQ
jgi:hypothetical protein